MNTVDAIRSRRAIKRFDPEHVISDQQTRELMSLAMLSPTAFNIQHWRFVIVKDRTLRENIRTLTWMQPQVTEASLLILICADLNAWQKQPQRYWRNIDAETRQGLLEAIHAYYADRPQVQRDEALRSCGIAAQTLMLAAKDMGYDSCPMDLSDMDEVGKLINLPEDHILSMFVAVGKATQEAYPRGGQLDMDEIVVTDRF